MRLQFKGYNRGERSQPGAYAIAVKLLCQCKGAEAGKFKGEDGGDDGEGVEDE